MRAARREECCSPRVESNEPPAMMDCQAEKIGVGGLPVSDQQCGGDLRVQEGKVVRPEPVMRMSGHLLQESQGFAWSYSVPDDLRI